ncbi:hypothetical protein [Streptomyces sp. NPDC054794]
MTITPPNQPFDDAFASFQLAVGAALPEQACKHLVERIRAVHADWPDLPFVDTADMARASLTAERRQVRVRLADLERQEQEAVEKLRESQAYLASRFRAPSRLGGLRDVVDLES